MVFACIFHIFRLSSKYIGYYTVEISLISHERIIIKKIKLVRISVKMPRFKDGFKRGMVNATFDDANSEDF